MCPVLEPRAIARRLPHLACALAAAGLVGARPAVAQAPLSLPVPRYHPLLLDCAVYRQQVESEIELASGPHRSRERAGRDGLLLFRATRADSAIRLEAWFDSLAVWREGQGGRVAPETDGVIGGRFRGTLTPLGAYREEEAPFVPDEVSAVSDVASALAEFFPPLAAGGLGVGETAAAGADWRITRLQDGVYGGRRTWRYRLTRTVEGGAAALLPDSAPVAARRTEEEEGVFQWDPERGPVRWERDIRAAVELPAGGGVPRSVRAAVRQRVVVVREQAGGAGCGPG